MAHDPHARPGETTTGEPGEGQSPDQAARWSREDGWHDLSNPSAAWGAADDEPKFPRGRKAVATLAVMALLVGAVTGAGVLEAENLKSVPASAAGVVAPTRAAGPPVAAATMSPIVKSVSASIVAVTASHGNQSPEVGTGMIITPTGQVLTNNHVIDGATIITVALNGSTTQLPATLVGADPDQDLALLQIPNQSGLPAVTLADSSHVQVGDTVVAIGSALVQEDSATVTSGTISAVNGQITTGATGSATETHTGLLRTDAAINPGNSGGALLDSSGQVIGMNTATAGSADGTSAPNIGFAIPSNQLESLLSGLRAGGDGSQTDPGQSSSSNSSGSGPSGAYQSPGGYDGLAF